MNKDCISTVGSKRLERGPKMRHAVMLKLFGFYCRARGMCFESVLLMLGTRISTYDMKGPWYECIGPRSPVNIITYRS